MKLMISKEGRQITSLTRQIGYVPQKSSDWNETAFTRSLMGGEFPRFHLYIKEDGAIYIFNLHLDQQQSKYGRNAAHGGEYDGELVENEAARIKMTLVKEAKAKPAGESNKAEIQSKEKSAAKDNGLSAIFKKIFER